MQLRYNYRTYPDASQRCALASAFGCARVVWNDCLRDRKEAHAAGLPYMKSAELSRLRITQAKRTAERAWLADVSAVNPVESRESRADAQAYDARARRRLRELSEDLVVRALAPGAYVSELPDGPALNLPCLRSGPPSCWSSKATPSDLGER